MTMRKLIGVGAVAFAATVWAAQTENVALPRNPAALRFAVIGDNGTGDKPQYEVGNQMAAARARFPFEFVIMLGDNMYGRQQPQDFVTKFERPYAALLQSGIPFRATLGNHDDQANRFYTGFNMGGERYYTYQVKNARFFVFDTNLLDPQQLAWIDATLNRSTEDWKICYFHHPLYSDAGRHGSDVELRVTLEPLLVRYGVNVVFSGHDHIYERLNPQKGITYFVEGSSGQLRRGDITPSPATAAAFADDQTFMLVGIAGDVLSFETVSRTGRVVDAGVITRRRPT